MITVANANALHIPLADQTVQCVITSPPYWGLRDYGTAKWEGGSAECDHTAGSGGHLKDSIASTRGGANKMEEAQRIPYRDICPRCGARRIDAQIGLEATLAEYVAHIVAVMREVWRVLRPNGTVWLNLGDSYAGGASGLTRDGLPNDLSKPRGNGRASLGMVRKREKVDGLKPKDLCGIPWRVAFALQEDGWYLRSDIIWSKLNPMPESVTDRPTKAHEYVFLLTKQPRYYYDAEAIKEPSNGWNGSKFTDERDILTKPNLGMSERVEHSGRNRRSVWTVATSPYSGAKQIADYVGDDGKPYRASPDCPIHGHLARKRTSYIAGYDEQPDRSPNRNSGNGNGHEQAHASLQSAMISHSAKDERGENVQRQNPESIDDYRSEVHHLESTSLDQTSDRTNHKSMSDEPSDRTSDSRRREYDLSASAHNKRKNKTARARRTSQHDTASEEIHDHTQSMLPIDECPDLDGRIDANNSGEDYASNETQIDPSVQKVSRIARIDSSFDTSHMRLYCTCEVVSTDHFATFPSALIEPMILAGTSPQACEHCGAPWERVVERSKFDQKSINTKSQNDEMMRNDGDRNLGGSQFNKFKADHPDKFIGWQPTCACDNNTGSGRCLVLDPFAGSGTTGAVAVKHGRRAVLLDLNTKYIDLQFERTNGVQMVMSV